jgi:transcriptional regulator with XRE-family HTH domain
MHLHSKQELHEKLKNPKYREAFLSSRIAQIIAAQVKVMRQKKEMSQKDLARELGTSQNAIYRLENPKYGRPNISTLRKVASFFDVGLVVRFGSFSEIVDWTLAMTEASIDVPTFTDDAGFVEKKPAASQSGNPILQRLATATASGFAPPEFAAEEIASKNATKAGSAESVDWVRFLLDPVLTRSVKTDRSSAPKLIPIESKRRKKKGHPVRPFSQRRRHA